MKKRQERREKFQREAATNPVSKKEMEFEEGIKQEEFELPGEREGR